MKYLRPRISRWKRVKTGLKVYWDGIKNYMDALKEDYEDEKKFREALGGTMPEYRAFALALLCIMGALTVIVGLLVSLKVLFDLLAERIG